MAAQSTCPTVDHFFILTFIIVTPNTSSYLIRNGVEWPIWQDRRVPFSLSFSHLTPSFVVTSHNRAFHSSWALLFGGLHKGSVLLRCVARLAQRHHRHHRQSLCSLCSIPCFIFFLFRALPQRWRYLSAGGWYMEKYWSFTLSNDHQSHQAPCSRFYRVHTTHCAQHASHV